MYTEFFFKKATFIKITINCHSLKSDIHKMLSISIQNYNNHLHHNNYSDSKTTLCLVKF